jgi:LacI family transcriptional regulator
MARRRKRVVLALPLTNPFLAKVFFGIADYARRNAHWEFVTALENISRPLTTTDLAGWPVDGVIAYVAGKADLRAATELAMPVVNLAGAPLPGQLPRVTSDFRSCGALAAEHLMGRGFTRFAYYGLRDYWFSDELAAGFGERVARVGAEVDVLEVAGSDRAPCPWDPGMPELMRWLGRLKLPVGLLAAYDTRAVVAVEACRRAGLRVPGDVAVVGVNNDETACEFCDPPLTSVDRDCVRLGNESAALLDRLMSGQRPRVPEVRVPPRGVVERASTDVLAAADRLVARALEVMRARAGERIGVEQVASALGVSRRWLERRFQDALGVTPHWQMCLLRVERVKRLLKESGRSRVEDLAAHCGFADGNRLRIVFRRIAGVPLSHYMRPAGRGRGPVRRKEASS